MNILPFLREHVSSIFGGFFLVFAGVLVFVDYMQCPVAGFGRAS